MRLRLGELFAGLILLSLTLLCFARLVAEPSGLLVDGDRASVDHAQRDDFRPIGNDLTFYYLPHYIHLADQVARFGRVPHWDPTGFAGRPLVGNPQAGLFYPPLRLIWRLQAPSALGWLTVGHLLWASLGLFVLMRSLGAGPFAATVAAGCFQASPYVLAQVFEGHYPHVWAACWYPWAFWAYVQFRRRRWIWAWTLAPILALTLLTGHPQEWFYLLFVLSLWAGWDAIRAGLRGELVAAVLILGGWSLVVALSLGLAAVELLPDMAAQAWTLRGSQLALGKVSRYQLHLPNLFQLLSPGALGTPDNYFGDDNYWETVSSIGLIPLVLVAVAATRHPNRRLVRGWLWLIVGALVFAAGRKFGLFPLLFECVPGMNRFRVPARSLFLSSLGAAVLAGFGVETLASRAFAAEDWQWLARRLRISAIVVGTIILGLLPFAELGRANVQSRPERPLSLREIRVFLRSQGASRSVAAAAGQIVRSEPFWFATVGLGVVILLAARRSGEEARLRFALAMGLMGLIELGWAGSGLLKVAPPSRFLGSDPISRALRDATPPVAGPFRIRARDTLYTDLRALANGFEKINVNDSFQLQHAADLYEPLYQLLYVPPAVDPKSAMSEIVGEIRQENRQRVLDRMNVAFLVSDHVETDPHWPLLVSGTTEGSNFSVHRNPTAMPRAYVVPRAEPTNDDVGSMLAGFRAINPREAVLMAGDPLPPAGSRQPFTPAVWSSNDPDRVVLNVTTEAKGLLVVADTWMPGWEAQDNGRPVRLHRGNHAQRVIPLAQAGRHEVVLRYEAPGLKRGVAVTLASISAWVAVFVAMLAWHLKRTP